MMVYQLEMKKLFCSLLALFLWMNLYAQDSSAIKWSIGVSSSYDYFNYKFNNYEYDLIFNKFQFKKRNNFTYGLTISYDIKNKTRFITGLFYSEKGFLKIYNYDYQSVEPFIQEINIKLSYIEIPALLNYNISLKQKMDLYTATGLSMNFLSKETDINYYRDGSRVKQTNPSILSKRSKQSNWWEAIAGAH